MRPPPTTICDMGELESRQTQKGGANIFLEDEEQDQVHKEPSERMDDPIEESSDQDQQHEKQEENNTKEQD